MYKSVFLDPSAPYHPDATPTQRRAAAVADMNSALGDCMMGNKPPNFVAAMMVLMEHINDEKLNHHIRCEEPELILQRLSTLTPIVIRELQDEKDQSAGFKR
jgi:hypothetical protein